MDATYADALAKAEHLIALGRTTVYLHDSEDDTRLPWDKVISIRGAGSYRMNGPSSCYGCFEEAGLTFLLTLDFEGRDAVGRGVSMFDRAKLRDVMVRMQPAGRVSLAEFLRIEVLPSVEKHTEEVRGWLVSQWDSEDCVRGLIEYGSRPR